MKKTVPFKKEINFKTNIAEITSISLEHTLKIDDDLISGDFIISGEYKIADISTNTEGFTYNLPFEIVLDDKYLLDKVTIDIDDFYYEIVNERILSIGIDVAIDNLVEKPLIEPVIEDDILEEELEDSRIEDIIIEEALPEENEEQREFFDTTQYNEEILQNPIKIEEKIEKVVAEGDNMEGLKVDNLDIFNNFNSTEKFSIYRVCIVRDGDIIDSILERYMITKEQLEKYNDLSDLKIGDKLIIPSE